MPGAPILLAVIGGGNMGAALVQGLLDSGVVEASELAVCEALPARRDQLDELLAGVAVTADVPSCSAAVLAVKPPDVPGAAVAAVAAGVRRLLSIAAGVTTGAIERAVSGLTSDRVAVVRAMPNTPALVGAGAAAISPGSAASADDVSWAESILGAVGTVEVVDEALLDAVTALSGSGPAYLYLVVEALVAGAVEAGLPADLAQRLTTQLLVGSARLLAVRGDPAALRQMVTSPGGTTAAGLGELEQRDVRRAFAAAIDAATRRSRELSADA